MTGAVHSCLLKTGAGSLRLKCKVGAQLCLMKDASSYVAAGLHLCCSTSDPAPSLVKALSLRCGTQMKLLAPGCCYYLGSRPVMETVWFFL